MVQLEAHRPPHHAPPCAARVRDQGSRERHHAALRRGVARTVNASPELIEDACQAAWTILLRAQPDRSPTLLAWLRTVAVHEAYRLLHRDLDPLDDRARDDWDGGRSSARAGAPLEARPAQGVSACTDLGKG